MTEAEAVGLSALLNSALIDRYFRTTNGNTQVNATDLRALSLPPLEVIDRLGRAVMAAGQTADVAWDTEVWLAEMPDHLIHYNGDRFLGPRS